MPADDAIPWPTVRFAPLTDEVRAASRAETFARRPGDGPVWVFAYGSLMWRPCFEAAERRTGTIAGYRRSFCFWTMVSRGTPDRPGLGLGIEAAAGARCHGMVYRLSDERLEEDLAALWDREMFGGVYVPRWVDVALDEPDSTPDLAAALVRSGYGLRALIPTQRSLEDVFVDLVTAEAER